MFRVDASTMVAFDKLLLFLMEKILQSMTYFSTDVPYCQDPAFSDSIRHVMDGSLPNSLKHIIRLIFFNITCSMKTCQTPQNITHLIMP